MDQAGATKGDEREGGINNLTDSQKNSILATSKGNVYTVDGTDGLVECALVYTFPCGNATPLVSSKAHRVDYTKQTVDSKPISLTVV